MIAEKTRYRLIGRLVFDCLSMQAVILLLLRTAPVLSDTLKAQIPVMYWSVSSWLSLIPPFIELFVFCEASCDKPVLFLVLYKWPCHSEPALICAGPLAGRLTHSFQMRKWCIIELWLNLHYNWRPNCDVRAQSVGNVDQQQMLTDNDYMEPLFLWVIFVILARSYYFN